MANRNRNRVESDEDQKFERNGKGRSRKPSRGGSNRKSKDKEKEGLEKDPKKQYNKVAYYIRNKLLLDQASRLSFQNFIGGDPINNYQIPSIMQIYMNPSPGLTYTKADQSIINHPARSGINMAGIKLFNELSMKSGRNMAYAPQDVSMAILAMSQLLAMHSYVRRLFGAIGTWNNYNRMFPKAIIEAMGIDYQDFADNYSDYRTRYNALISAANQLPILMNCGYLEKSLDQFSYIFTDDDSPMAQVYLYLPETTWIIDETSYSGGTILSTVKVCTPGGTTRTFADLMINVLRPMVNMLLQSSTLNLVYADLLNLASKGSDYVNFVVLDLIEDGVAVKPFHNYEALLHIHNMVAVGNPDCPTLGSYTTPFNDVYPDPSINAIIYNPGRTKSTYSREYVPNTVILDSPNADPGVEERLEMTRYVSLWTYNGEVINGVAYQNYTLVTDYYVTSIYVITNDSSTPTLIHQNHDGLSGVAFTEADLLSQFDWHPIMRLFDGTLGVGPTGVMAPYDHILGDLNFYTTVRTDYIERLNEVVYLGLFDMGKHQEM